MFYFDGLFVHFLWFLLLLVFHLATVSVEICGRYPAVFSFGKVFFWFLDLYWSFTWTLTCPLLDWFNVPVLNLSSLASVSVRRFFCTSRVGVQILKVDKRKKKKRFNQNKEADREHKKIQTSNRETKRHWFIKCDHKTWNSSVSSA